MVLWLRFLTEINSNTKEESGDVDYELSPYNQGSIRHLFIVAYRPLSFLQLTFQHPFPCWSYFYLESVTYNLPLILVGDYHGSLQRIQTMQGY